MVWKQNGSGGLANGCASMPTVHAPEQSGQGGFLLVRAEVFGWPCFGIACAWAEEVQPVSRKTLGFAEKWYSKPIRLHRLVPGVHDIPQFLSLVARSTAITTSHHEDYSFSHLPPTATLPDKLLRHPRSLVIVELLSSPILSPQDFTFRLFSSTTKATPRFALIH
jgi:hypothetical protein